MENEACSGEPLSDALKAERARRGWGNGPVGIVEAARLGIKPSCATVSGGPSGPNHRWEHVGQNPGSVAFALAMSGGRGSRVVDRTGIAETFMFAWEFGPDESTPGALREMARERIHVPSPGFDAPLTAPKAPAA